MSTKYLYYLQISFSYKKEDNFLNLDIFDDTTKFYADQILFSTLVQVEHNSCRFSDKA